MSQTRKGETMIRASEVLYILTRADLLEVAREEGIPDEMITDDIFKQVRKGVESAWEGWPDVVRAALAHALKS